MITLPVSIRINLMITVLSVIITQTKKATL